MHEETRYLSMVPVHMTHKRGQSSHGDIELQINQGNVHLSLISLESYYSPFMFEHLMIVVVKIRNISYCILLLEIFISIDPTIQQ